MPDDTAAHAGNERTARKTARDRVQQERDAAAARLEETRTRSTFSAKPATREPTTTSCASFPGDDDLDDHRIPDEPCPQPKADRGGNTGRSRAYSEQVVAGTRHDRDRAAAVRRLMRNGGC